MNNHSDIFEAIIIKHVINSRTANVIASTAYLSPVTVLVIALVTCYIFLYNRSRARMVSLINKIPGPPSLPLIGNTVEVNVEHDGE